MTPAGSRTECGDTVVQVVIAVPIVLSVLLISMQAMLFLHSSHIAVLAATKGASVVANTNGDIVLGINSATLTVVELGAQLYGVPTADVSDGFVVMQVRVVVPRVAPFFASSVLRQGEEPLEAFVAEDER